MNQVVTSKVPDSGGPSSGSANLSMFVDFVSDTLALADVELRKLRRDPAELVTRAIQPALWLLIFGQVFARFRAIPTGGLDYLTFMTPGILAQSVLFIPSFTGSASFGKEIWGSSKNCWSVLLHDQPWFSVRRSPQV